jgi:hypothetical protein
LIKQKRKIINFGTLKRRWKMPENENIEKEEMEKIVQNLAQENQELKMSQAVANESQFRIMLLNSLVQMTKQLNSIALVLSDLNKLIAKEKNIEVKA